LPVLVIGYGYIKAIIGRADLLAISGIARLFLLPGLMMYRLILCAEIPRIDF